jgi:hypothetical protein
MSTTRLRKVSTPRIPYKDTQKELTFTLNEIYFTNGKPMENNENISEVQEIIGSKKNLFNKKINSIGTSLKNCDLSDMISIDIDAESTRLPLMCKLMIIVEGAAYERGHRVLVRDESTQVGDDNINNKMYSNENDNKVRAKSIPVIQISEKEDDFEKIQRLDTIERKDFTKYSKTFTNKYKSSESVNHETYNHINNPKKNRSRFVRNTGGGSLSNLFVSSHPDEYFCSEYFNRKRRDLHSSHIDLYEYTSIPYYQYQRKNFKKCDFSCNTIHINENKSKSINNDHESIEVHIPIRIIPEHHRNEKRIIINKELDKITCSDFSATPLATKIKRIIDERINRFEAEITFYNLNDTTSSSSSSLVSTPRIRIEPHPNILSFKQTDPISYSCQYQQSSELCDHYNKQYRFLDDSSKSVTNLMLMRVINGRLLE